MYIYLFFLNNYYTIIIYQYKFAAPGNKVHLPPHPKYVLGELSNFFS